MNRIELLNLCDFNCNGEIYGIEINNTIYSLTTCDTCAFYVLLEIFDKEFRIPKAEPPHHYDTFYGQGCTLRYRKGGHLWDAQHFYNFVEDRTYIVDNEEDLPNISDYILDESEFPLNIPQVFLTKDQLIALLKLEENKINKS